MHFFVRMWFVFAQSRTERQACVKWTDFRGDTTNHRWLQKMCRLPSEGWFDKPHIACLTCKEGIASGLMQPTGPCHFACLTMTVTVTSSLKLSPWCFHCHAKCSALYVLFVEQGISCNAAYHDKLRCKALQSLQIKCIDVSRVEKITGNSNTSTRKQMTWNMSAWL